MTAGSSPVRLAEPVAALSLATDLGMGQPLEQALRTCLLAVAAGSALGLDGPTHSDTYYFALLRFVGCTSDAHEQAALVGGDEIAFYAGVAPMVMGEGETAEFLAFLIRRFPLATRRRLRLPGMARRGSVITPAQEPFANGHSRRRRHHGRRFAGHDPR